MPEYSEIIERLEKATGPALDLDGRVWCAINGYEFVQWDGAGCVYRDQNARAWDRGIKHADARTVRPYTASLDAAVALVERVLPGWWWKVGTCSVSDDACIAPDFNSPIHGERLKAELSYDTMKAGDEFDGGFDVDRRPPGNVPIALLLALFRALQAKGERNG